MQYVLYIIAGLVGGVLGGMGMGGGTILIPVLVLMLGVPQKIAQATNLIAFVPMAIITLILHFKNKMISGKNVLLIIIPGAISCVLGCYLAKIIETNLLGKLFGGFLTLLSLYQIVCNSKKKSKVICANSTKELDKESVEKTIKKSSKI